MQRRQLCWFIPKGIPVWFSQQFPFSEMPGWNPQFEIIQHLHGFNVLPIQSACSESTHGFLLDGIEAKWCAMLNHCWAREYDRGCKIYKINCKYTYFAEKDVVYLMLYSETRGGTAIRNATCAVHLKPVVPSVPLHKSIAVLHQSLEIEIEFATQLGV